MKLATRKLKTFTIGGSSGASGSTSKAGPTNAGSRSPTFSTINSPTRLSFTAQGGSFSRHSYHQKAVRPFPWLPSELYVCIWKEAALDIATASSLVLVSKFVRTQIDPILYSRVTLDTKEKIRHFSTITIPAKLHAAAAPVQPSSDHISSLHPQMHPKPIHRHQVTPPLPIPQVSSTSSSSTSTSHFFECVKYLSLVLDEDHFRIRHPDILTCSRIILIACTQVHELEISGDFLRPPPDPSRPPWPPEELALSNAAMRPHYLTLVPPHNTVDFGLTLLERVTHLRYAKTPPRHLGYRRSINGMRMCGRVRYVAFDFQLENEGSTTSTFVGIVKEALAALPVEEHEMSLSHLNLDQPASAPSTSPSTSSSAATANESGLSSGVGIGFPVMEDEDSDRDPFNSSGSTTPAPGPVVEFLTLVVVRIILTPHKPASLSKFHTVWHRLHEIRQQDARLVYFPARWQDNELFGEDIWDRAEEMEREKDFQRSLTSGAGAGTGEERGNLGRSWSFTTGSGTIGGGGGSSAGGRRRSSSLTLSWYQDR